GNPSISDERRVYGCGMRYRSRYRRCRSGQDFRGVPTGRQLDHAQEGRDRSRPVDRLAHHRVARWTNLGRIGARQRIDLLFHAPSAGGGTSEGIVSKRILAVEDQPDNRQILRDLLTRANFEVIEAEDGEAGLTAAAHRPDLILMDIQLPGFDGYEATRRLKADEALHAIPVIAITAYELNEAENKARAAGCDAYMAKPISPRQLPAKVRENFSLAAPTR